MIHFFKISFFVGKFSFTIFVQRENREKLPSLFFPAIMIGMKRDKRTTTPNEHIEITITGAGQFRRRVGKVKGFTYFIPGAFLVNE